MAAEVSESVKLETYIVLYKEEDAWIVDMGIPIDAEDRFGTHRFSIYGEQNEAVTRAKFIQEAYKKEVKVIRLDLTFTV